MDIKTTVELGDAINLHFGYEDGREVAEFVFAQIRDWVQAGEKVQVNHFGTWRKKQVPERAYKVPQPDGSFFEAVIPAHDDVLARAAKNFMWPTENDSHFDGLADEFDSQPE